MAQGTTTVTVTGEQAFVNSYRHGLDSKRRITIPSEWRAQMGAENSLYVLPDVSHKCLFMVTPLMMNFRLERIRNQPMSDSKARDFYRALGARSERIFWDTQGRFRIKDELLNYAQIKNEVVMLGTIDRIEVWDPTLLEQMGLVAEQQFEEAAKHVGF